MGYLQPIHILGMYSRYVFSQLLSVRFTPCCMYWAESERDEVAAHKSMHTHTHTHTHTPRHTWSVRFRFLWPGVLCITSGSGNFVNGCGQWLLEYTWLAIVQTPIAILNSNTPLTLLLMLLWAMQSASPPTPCDITLLLMLPWARVISITFHTMWQWAVTQASWRKSSSAAMEGTQYWAQCMYIEVREPS